MSMQSFLAKAGLRLSVLGSAASLAIAAPLAAGNPDPAAHTDASRIGVYFDRTAAAEKMGVVVMGAEILSVGVAGVTSTVKVITPASTLTSASLNIPFGVAPAAPVNGDMWTDASGLFLQAGGVKTILSGSGSANRIPYYLSNSVLTNNTGYLATLTAGALLVSHTQTSTAVANTNLHTAALTVNPGGISAAMYTAADFSVSTTAAIAGNLTGATIKGVNVTANLNSSVAATLASTICTNNTINVTNSSAASLYTLTNVYGFYQGGGTMTTTNAGASTVVTNYYGIYLAAPITAGAGTTTITNRYGIFQADPLANNVVYGFVNIGQAADTIAHLNVYGGNTGGSMIRLVRTVGPVVTYAWALTGGGLSFADETAGATTTNIFGNGGENQLYIGQKLTNSVYSRTSILSGTTFSTNVDVAACGFVIQSSLGTGAGAVGSIVFRTGVLGVTGAVTHTTADRMTIQGAAGSAFVQIAASTADNASLNLPHGVAPTVPVNGDIWTTTTGLFARINGATQTILSGTGAANQVSFWTGTGTQGGNSGFTATLASGALAVANVQSSTATVGTPVAITASITAAPVVASAAAFKGAETIASVGVNANASGAALIGCDTSTFQSGATVAGTTTVAVQAGNRSTTNIVNSGAAGTLTTSIAYGYLARPLLTASAGSTATITTYYGLYIDQPTLSGAGTTTIGTRYGVFQVDPLAANVFAGATTIGTLTASAAQLIVQGGSAGSPIIRLHRTSGGTATFAWALVGGGLSFTDEIAGAVTTNIFGDTNTNFLYLGQRNKTAADTRISFLSGTTFGASAGTDTPAADFVIQGGLGYGTGAPGVIIFRTGVAAASGNPHTTTNRLTFLDGANGFRFANATGSGYNFQFSDGSNSFRSVNSNSFSDVVSSTFFQTGQTSGVGVFTAQNGSPYSRSLYLTNALVISAGVAPHNTATTAPPPTGVFEIHNTTAGPTTVLLFRINAVSGSAFVQTPAATTANASLNIPHGVAPTVPVNGDMWTTTAGLFVQINGSTVALGGGGGTPAGSDTELQFNNAGAFGASANLSYSSTYAKTVIANQYGAMYIAGQPNPSVGTYHLSSVYVDTDVATSAASGFTNGVFSYVKHAATTVNPTLRGVRALVSATGSAAGAGSSVYGVFSEAFNSRSAGTSNVYGGSFAASCNASGGGGDAYGISASATKTTGNNTGGAIGGSFTVTSQATTSSDVFALYARVNVISGTLTTVYGLYIDVGTGTVTNRYGIYQVGPTAKNVFEGFTGLGGSVASTTTILNLPPGTTAVSSLRISQGVAPTSPVNGDMWTTSSGLFYNIGGVAYNAVGTRLSWGTPVLSVSGTATITGSSVSVANFNTTVVLASAAASTVQGIRNVFTLNGVNGVDTQVTGCTSDITMTAATSGATIYLATGFKTTVDLRNTAGAGTVATFRAAGLDLNVLVRNLAAGSTWNVDYVYGVKIEMSYANTGTMNITNAYGLYIGDVGGMTTSNRFGIYQAGDNATRNFFSGNVGIWNQPSASSFLVTGTSDTARSAIRIPHGAAPTAPVDGDMWTTTAGLYIRINGATVGPLT